MTTIPLWCGSVEPGDYQASDGRITGMDGNEEPGVSAAADIVSGKPVTWLRIESEWWRPLSVALVQYWRDGGRRLVLCRGSPRRVHDYAVLLDSMLVRDIDRGDYQCRVDVRDPIKRREAQRR